MNSDDLLPSEVDVVVLGTGLPESIIAGACARSGLSVLHLDRNEYYGGVWSSFNLQSINSLFENLSSTTALNQDVDNEIDIKNIELNEGEEALAIGQYQPIQNVHLQWHITEADATESEQNGSIESDKSIRSDLEKNWRRFSIDLLPKVRFSDESQNGWM
ncbi:unnamed protein product [Anisakis simplex]|uniref:FAD_binding_3 domain-containing protein n=1 Tax=Anisakis simplex TaxID=6269 RepID=A0A0M3J9B3_ANISI|nr:unnamed protein product [Anisakis simplex]